MSEMLNDLKKYADHRGYPEELPNFNTTASRAVGEIVRLRAQLAKATAALEEIEDGLPHFRASHRWGEARAIAGRVLEEMRK